MEESLIYGGGILCYTIPPHSKEIYFILGRESGQEFSRKIWCDFTGARKTNESEEETAAREFSEESLGVVMGDAYDSLQNKEYTMKLLTCVNYGANIDIPRRYQVTFVKQVLWNPFIPAEFENLREELLLLQYHSSVCREQYLQLDKPRAFQKHQHHLLEDEEDDMEEEAEDIEIIDSETDEDLDDYKQSLATLEDYFNSLPESTQLHPAVFQNEHGFMDVHSHYLEKDAIQFWALDRMKEVVGNVGHYKKEYFRNSFLPIIATVIEIFESGQTSDAYLIYCSPKNEDTWSKLV